MSESKCSQNDRLDDKSLIKVISSVLRHKKNSGCFQERHDQKSWFVTIAIQLPKYIDNYLSSQCVSWFLRTGNRIQSKTL